MSGHYSPIKSSQEFLVSRHKLPAIPTPKPSSPFNSAAVALSHSTNSPWMNKSGRTQFFETIIIRIPRYAFGSTVLLVFFVIRLFSDEYYVPRRYINIMVAV